MTKRLCFAWADNRTKSRYLRQSERIMFGLSKATTTKQKKKKPHSRHLYLHSLRRMRGAFREQTLHNFDIRIQESFSVASFFVFFFCSEREQIIAYSWLVSSDGPRFWSAVCVEHFNGDECADQMSKYLLIKYSFTSREHFQKIQFQIYKFTFSFDSSERWI